MLPLTACLHRKMGPGYSLSSSLVAKQTTADGPRFLSGMQTYGAPPGLERQRKRGSTMLTNEREKITQDYGLTGAELLPLAALPREDEKRKLLPLRRATGLLLPARLWELPPRKEPGAPLSVLKIKNFTKSMRKRRKETDGPTTKKRL